MFDFDSVPWSLVRLAAEDLRAFSSFSDGPSLLFTVGVGGGGNGSNESDRQGGKIQQESF